MKSTSWALLSPFFHQYSLRLTAALVVGMLSSVTTLLLPVSIGKYYALVFGFTGTRSALLDIFPPHYYDTVPHFLILFTVLIFISMVLNYGKRYLIASTGELLIFELRNRLFHHQLRLDTRIYEEKGTGKYLLRYSGDLKSLQNYLTKGIIGFASDVGLLILCLAFLISISPLLALISLISSAVILGPIYLLNQQLHRVSVIRRNKKAGLLSFVNQRLQTILTIKAFNRAVLEEKKFHKRSDKIYRAGLQFHRWSSLIYVLIPSFLYGMLALIMYVIYYQKTQGNELDQASLLAAFLLILTLLPVCRRSLRVGVIWKLGLISIQKLQKVLELPIEKSAGSEALMLTRGNLTVNQLSFGYEAQTIFQELSTTWTGHGLHVILGGAGSGKSSMVKLLLGVYQSYQGHIYIDDQDIRTLSIKSLRKHISVVSDSFPLLGKTVFEAISYSRKPSKRSRAAKVLARVQQGLPSSSHLSLEDRIGDMGNNLSSSQRQVLQFTRALLTRKPIIILDEPFYRISDVDTRRHFIRLVGGIESQKHTILLSTQTPVLNRDCV